MTLKQIPLPRFTQLTHQETADYLSVFIPYLWGTGEDVADFPFEITDKETVAMVKRTLETPMAYSWMSPWEFFTAPTFSQYFTIVQRILKEKFPHMDIQLKLVAQAYVRDEFYDEREAGYGMEEAPRIQKYIYEGNALRMTFV
jgi:hypothetical protein